MLLTRTPQLRGHAAARRHDVQRARRFVYPLSALDTRTTTMSSSLSSSSPLSLFYSIPWEVKAFVLSLFFYHVSEFTIAAVYNRCTLSSSSWLLSTQYCIAMAAACVEYALEYALVPSLKGHGVVSAVGLAMVVCGDGLRKVAEVTARHNFTHQIMLRKRPEHRLVQHGVYRFMRHPGYLGWLWWSVGTQVLLCNPACAVGFAYVGWRFFERRVQFEEARLRDMFPGTYAAYAAKTPTFIPGIK